MSSCAPERWQTAVTLSRETPAAIDRQTNGTMSRSEFVERAVVALLDRLSKQQQDQRDL